MKQWQKRRPRLTAPQGLSFWNKLCNAITHSSGLHLLAVRRAVVVSKPVVAAQVHHVDEAIEVIL